MKHTSTLLTLITALSLSSCASKVTQSPVFTAPSAPSTPVRSPSKPRVVAPKPDGALRQVPATPPVTKPKVFPDIPLKEDTGVSPLIHTKPDTPSYKRSKP